MANRSPLKLPGNKLPNKYLYDPEDAYFLEFIKPWKAKHYKQDSGSTYFDNIIDSIKTFIYVKLEVIQDNYCAFCGLDLDIVRLVHREHIAPQYQQNHYIFEPENIVLACFDCNMKKGRTGTIVKTKPANQRYAVEAFKILHPYRDNFGDFLVAYYENGGLIFELKQGITDPRAIKTIKALGLADTTFIAERGMRIRNRLIPATGGDDTLIREALNIPHRKLN